MTRRRKWRRLLAWGRRARVGRKLTVVLIVAAILSGIATFATMSGTTAPFGPNPGLVVGLLYLDVVLLLLLVAVVARPLTRVWVARKRGRAGSRLHVRLVMMFSLVAVAPAVVVAIFSGVFLNFGIQAWFGERVGTVVNNSRAVAQAYLEEHHKAIRADILAMANDINRDAPYLAGKTLRFSRFLEAQAAVRELTEAAVIDGAGKVLARTTLSLSLTFESLPMEALRRATSGEVVTLSTGLDERFRALIRLDRFVDTYLVVGRFIDPEVVAHIVRTEGAFKDYKNVEERRESMQITFILIFVVLALLLLMVSVRVGLILASSLVQPIGALIGAAERIRRGDLSARAEAHLRADEMGTLGRVFNRMALQLENQQRGLMEANRELDERRRFTETVLAGVSAGVIGLDPTGGVSLFNRSAENLLRISLAGRIGAPLSEVVPEMGDLLEDVRRRPVRLRHAEIRVAAGGRTRVFLARIAAETLAGDTIGYVLTFDDITDLQTAQRQAAWADVARRIAHEIKNPLTPIQLSAERLKRRYLKQIDSDPETFVACTETIVRQVHDIGRMVDEFSSFARMPEPNMKAENLSDLVRQTVSLERNRAEAIRFDVASPPDPLWVKCDPRQIRQALINLLKNASEALTESPGATASPAIEVRLSVHEESEAARMVVIDVLDNGPGLPQEDRERLTEPYVTTRPKGTGLGLAIARKIMEDHAGELILADREGGGTRASLIFEAGSTETGEPVKSQDANANPMDAALRLTTDGP